MCGLKWSVWTLFAFFIVQIYWISETGSSTLDFPKTILEIHSKGQRYHFLVEIAGNQEQRRKGLMHRTIIPINTGMLFVFDRQTSIQMWMKNTPISLDMIFADIDMTIVSIARETKPFSTQIIRSIGPAKYVLEVRAGTASRLKLSVGDKLSWRQ